jgi:nucleotide-binding universal stress UspA family protein
MGLYERILVTIDCSRADATILEHIAALAAIHGSEVTLLHVVHSHTLDQDRFMSEKASTALDEAKRCLEGAGLRVSTILRSGEPEEELLKEIKAADYDLLAMATHGHSHAAGLLLGSVSEHVKHRIHIPMLLIRSKESS